MKKRKKKKKHPANCWLVQVFLSQAGARKPRLPLVPAPATWCEVEVMQVLSPAGALVLFITECILKSNLYLSLKFHNHLLLDTVCISTRDLVAWR